MAEPDPVSSQDSRGADGTASGEGVPRPPAPPARDPANAFLAHLQSLRELQITLSQEGRAEAILSEGTTGTVEIVGADCAIAIVEPSSGIPPLRFGWIEGRLMAQHELSVLTRRLEEPIQRVRSGAVSRIVLGEGGNGNGHDAHAAVPGGGAKEAGPFGALLVLGVDSAMGSRGALVLGRHDPVPFSREQVFLADILASFIALQIERALRATDARRASERLQEESAATHRRLQEISLELAALNSIAAAASPSLDLGRQIEVSLRKAIEVTGFKAGAIALVEESGGAEILKAAQSVGDTAYLDLTRSLQRARGEGIAGRVWATGEAVAFADLSAGAALEGCADELAGLRRAGYRALACVPLRARGRIIGTMDLLSNDARPELESRPGLAESIAGQIAIVIQNSRLLSDMMRHSLDLEARSEKNLADRARSEEILAGLLAAAQAASRTTDLRALAEALLGRAIDLASASAGTVHLVDPGTRELRLKAERGMPRRVLEELDGRVGRTIIGRAFETGRPHLDPGGTAEHLDAATGLRFQAAFPLRALSGVHGILAIARADDRLPGEAEMLALTALSELFGLSVENARAFEKAPPSVSPQAELLPQLVQAQKMESIGTLAGGIAHEFNNILASILGYASHIESLTSSDNPIRREAATIARQAKRAAELTQQLVAFARGGQYSLEPVDLNRSIAETVSFLSKSIDPRIVVEIRKDPDLPLIEADAGQMQQVLMNLAVNAAEAMPDGGRITFETRVAHLDQSFVRSQPGLAPGDYVEAVVGDTGTGMQPDIADRVFEPFFTTKTNGKGTGLGLSVVYGIVRNHQGHISLASTPGLGTTVRVYFPVLDRGARRPAMPPQEPASSGGPWPAPGPPPAPRQPARTPLGAGPFERVSVYEPDRRRGKPPEPAGPPSAATPAPSVVTTAPSPGPAEPRVRAPAAGKGPARARILVVDDEEAIREMTRDILESGGCEVVLATDGVDALDVYRREWGRLDLVLLDMVMPRMGGLETFRRLIGMDRGARILLCSGYADNDKAQRALKEGALGLLPKPFTMTELLSRIDRILAKR
ncbi:MAG TPA: response regulator [Candidatus Polarisedimenticolia bacterium]|jgi:signal transduction histidine kinase|nr:response regulator [Candidatus Polarisedimenticolia bacterium]